MLNNVVLWSSCGIMVISVAALLLIWRELKKIYYRGLSYRETLDRSLTEVKNKGEEIIGKIGENTGRLKAVEDKMTEFKKGILEEIAELKGQVSLFETRFDTIRETLDRSLAEVKKKEEEIIGKIGENTGRLKAVEDNMAEFKKGITELNRRVSLFETRFGAIDKSLLEVNSNVQLKTDRLEGKITGISEKVTETRYNDFLNYSLKLVEEAKVRACIDEKLYNTLLELFHNLKVDHYIK